MERGFLNKKATKPLFENRAPTECSALTLAPQKDPLPFPVRSLTNILHLLL